MLIQIEQECLDVYKKKVEQAVKSRAQLLEALSDARTELACLLSALGEKCFAEFVSSFTQLSLVYILCHHMCKVLWVFMQNSFYGLIDSEKTGLLMVFLGLIAA